VGDTSGKERFVGNEVVANDAVGDADGFGEAAVDGEIVGRFVEGSVDSGDTAVGEDVIVVFVSDVVGLAIGDVAGKLVGGSVSIANGLSVGTVVVAVEDPAGSMFGDCVGPHCCQELFS